VVLVVLLMVNIDWAFVSCFGFRRLLPVCIKLDSTIMLNIKKWFFELARMGVAVGNGLVARYRNAHCANG